MNASKLIGVLGRIHFHAEVPIGCDIKFVDKKMQVTGITDIMMSSIEQTLNCSYSYHLPAVLTYGSPGPNGTWKNGLMADIANNVIDMTFPGVARTPDRDLLADPAPPNLHMGVGILAGRNRTRDTNLAGYLMTFDTQVWMMLLLFLILLSILMAFLDVASGRMRRIRTVAAESWDKYFWTLFENMFCEASAVMPEKTVLRIVIAVWLLAIVVLMNAFSGQMRACLLVKNKLEKINTVEDIASRPHLKVYVLKNSIISHLLEHSQGVAERKVWSMIRRDNSDLFGLLHYPENMLREVLQEKAVVVHGNGISASEAGKFCSGEEIGEFYFGNENLYTLMIAAYMSRQMNVTLRKRIKWITTALTEAGIYNRKYTLAIPPIDRCSIIEEQQDLTLKDMGSVLYMYAVFIALSILVFIAEIISGDFTRRGGLS